LGSSSPIFEVNIKHLSNHHPSIELITNKTYGSPLGLRATYWFSTTTINATPTSAEISETSEVKKNGGPGPKEVGHST